MIARGAPQEDLPPGPNVDPSLAWIWRCWHRLNPDRPLIGGIMGVGVPGDIPWSLVARWADVHGLTRGELALLDRCVQAMDRTYRTWWNGEQEKAKERSAR